MSLKKTKKCCEKFKLGTCTARNCPFPHVLEAQKPSADAKKNKELKEKKIISRGKINVALAKSKLPKEEFFTLEDVEKKVKVSASDFANLTSCTIKCRRCGESFTMDKGEIEWFRNKRFTMPNNCRACRKFLRESSACM